MKRIYVFIIALMLSIVCITPVCANEEREKIKNYCKSQWGTDYQMIEFCYDTQMKAAKSVYANYFDPYINTLPTPLTSMDQLTPEAKIYLQCSKDWSIPEFNTYDFQMVKFCCDTQFKSYNRMK